MTVGNKIRKLRKERKLTQKQLGILCGINEVQIRRYELGGKNSNPKIETLQKIADALNVPLLEFLDDDLFDIATDDESSELRFLDEKIKSITESKEISDEEKKTQLQDLQVKMEILANMHMRQAEGAGKYILTKLFEELNYDGQEKAIEQIELLTKIPEYQKGYKTPTE